jgi:hypothetical protein
MKTSQQGSKPADQEVLDLLADLDSQFGKKKKDKDTVQARNTAFHQKNPQLDQAVGKAPELDQSGNWQAKAKVTYVIRQRCLCCNTVVEFIGGEYIMWESKRQHARILRQAGHSASIFLYDEIGEPLPDLIDEIDQQVSRCAGCIAVERQAEEIWGAVLKKQQQEISQQPLDFDLSKEIIIKKKTKAASDSDILNIKIEGL